MFTFCMSGWYLWCSLILSALDFPFDLPLGDLSKRIPSKSDREARKLENGGDTNGSHATKEA